MAKKIGYTRFYEVACRACGAEIGRPCCMINNPERWITPHSVRKSDCMMREKNVVAFPSRPAGPHTFRQVLEILRDGRARRFTTENLTGYFYKAPFPSDEKQTELDGAHSAITYWDKQTHERASPTLMLYDFDEGEDADPEWTVELAECHPATRRRQ